MTQAMQPAGGVAGSEPGSLVEKASDTLAVVQHWCEAYILRDIDAVMAAMTDDCVLETPTPAPDGRVFRGQTEVRAFWKEFFQTSHFPTFETEEMSAYGDRCVFRWIRRWTDGYGNPCHLRGMDVFRVSDGKIAEKLAYTKASAIFGAEPLATETSANIAAVQRFCDALNRHDIDAVMDAQTEDCLLDATYPYPDGTRYQGRGPVRAFWEEVFQRRPTISFECEEIECEEIFSVADRCILRFVCRWTEPDGTLGNFRGVDVYRVKEGKVAEKLAYQKRNR
jgi:ketosteroid isomerase-like protein